MAEVNCSVFEYCISIFISAIIFPLYKLYLFLKNNCWRISLNSANKLGYNQISDFTEENRYPEIFRYVQKLTIPNTHIMNILSFGCSSGIECQTLRNYFNNANITGYDIFEKNIEIAIKENTDENIHFTTKWIKVNQQSYYDIVFVMTVLCRTPHTYNKKDCSKIYSFNQFVRQIELLDRIIKRNGLLVIHNANFRFTDTETSQKYKPIEIPDYFDSGIVPKFNRNNILLDIQEYTFSVFNKIIE